MKISLREFEVFRRVMELGSVTAAASALHISQPAVSRTLQQAERQLGFALFVRHKKRLLPTAEAEGLFPETVNAFAAIESAQRRAIDLREGKCGVLNIAAIPAFANALLPEAIRKYRAFRPDVAIILDACSAEEVARRVASYRADIGLIIESTALPGTSVSELCATSFGCVVPAKHPLAKRKHVTPADLKNEHLICLSRRLPLGIQAARIFAEANVPLSIAVEVSQSTIACALVRAGAGVALLDGMGLMGSQNRDLVFRPFRPEVRIVSRLVQPRDRPCSRLAQEFTTFLRETILSSERRSNYMGRTAPVKSPRGRRPSRRRVAGAARAGVGP